MEQMRDLAHDGRTVIVVTHSIDNLDTCDRLLVLVPGGMIAFYGPPEEGLAYFGQSRWAEVFQDFERYPDRDWAAEFAASPAYVQYVLGQRPRPSQVPDSQDVPIAAPPQRLGRFRLTTLTRRYVRVIASDRGYLTFMGALPVILGVLSHFVGTSQGLFVSATVSRPERAVPFLVLLTMVQVILSGGLLSLSGRAGLAQLAWIAPSRWGFGAVASTANLNVISPALTITPTRSGCTRRRTGCVIWATRPAGSDLRTARLGPAAPHRPAPPPVASVLRCDLFRRQKAPSFTAT